MKHVERVSESAKREAEAAACACKPPPPSLSSHLLVSHRPLTDKPLKRHEANASKREEPDVSMSHSIRFCLSSIRS
jgi:hypothetical protein